MERSIYFETQTGIIRDHRSDLSNFYQFELPERARKHIEAEFQTAQLGSGGLEWNQEFLALLPIWERQWKREQLLRKNSKEVSQ